MTPIPSKINSPGAIQVKRSNAIKFKDREGRNQIKFNLKSFFGFVPEEVIIQKVPGRHDCITFMAVLTPEMLKKEAVISIATPEQIAKINKGKK